MLTNDELEAVLRGCKGKTVLQFGRIVEEATLRKASEHGPTCGENIGPVDADLVGCGKPIESQSDVYRCTHCGVPFHRDCAEIHFAETSESASRVYDEQLRRLDAKAAQSPRQVEQRPDSAERQLCEPRSSGARSSEQEGGGIRLLSEQQEGK